MTRLNLGSGRYTIKGFNNHDPDIDGWKYEDGLPYPDGSVEGITEAHSLMYVALEDWEFVFEEFYRVLVPGGIVRIHEDHTTHPQSERYGGYPGAVTLTSPHVVKRELAFAGFEVLDVNEETTFFHDRSLIQSLHGPHPKTFCCEGRKPCV